MSSRTSAAALLVLGVLPAVSAPFQSENADRLSADRLSLVKGIVTNVVTGEPLRKAYVGLEGKDGKSAITDDKGKFSIEKIEPASYTIEAERPGFLRDVVQVTLTAGQSLTDLAIALTPQASIAGRVVDDEGDVWTHVNVRLFRSAWKQGHRRLEGSGGINVDDRGEFRIADLEPGKYYVVAEPDSGWEGRFRSVKTGGMLLQPTWYPGAIDEEAATPMTLAAGQELAGLEIRLRRGAVRNIRGHVVGLSQIPKQGALSPWGGPRILAWRASNLSEPNYYDGTIQADGSFEMRGVPPGMYQLRVDRGTYPSFVLGRGSAQVDDRDVEDVTISLQPPRSIQGKITIEGNDAGDKAVKFSNLSIFLYYSRDNPEQIQVPRQDGSFVFEQLGVGRYRVDINGKRGEDVYLKAVRYGDAEPSDGFFTLAEGAEGAEGNLELVLSTRGARVTGTVQQSSGATANRTVQVVLVPDTSDIEKRESLTQREGLDQNGSFTIHAIPPGSYLLYAAEDVPQGAWSDPDFLQEVAAKGVKLQLGEGETKSIEVTVLSKASLAPVLSRLGIE
jgi:hypothetical protein